jgi:hypothetical protein
MPTNFVSADSAAPARLAPLLPWLNGDQIAARDVCRVLVGFLAAPIGGARVGLSTAEATALAAGTVSARKLAGVRRTVLAFLADTVLVRPGRTRPWPSRSWTLRLRVAVFSANRRRPDAPDKWHNVPRLTAATRRAYLGPGAYGVFVGGSLHDVVLYTVIQLLTEPGAVALAQCPAPSATDAARPCGRWFVRIGQRRGRPAKYCSDACRLRAFRSSSAKEGK